MNRIQLGYVMTRVVVSIIPVMLASTNAMVAQIPDPNGAAALFVSAPPGLAASDFCVGEGSSGSCQNGGVDFRIDLQGAWPLNADALGFLYPPQPLGGDNIGICELPTGSTVLTERFLQRISPNGTSEIVGVLRDRCESTHAAKVSSNIDIDLDPINGFMYLGFVVTNDAGSLGSASSYVVLKVSGLPTLLDIILSYQPPSTLSFNVPVHPEALPGADSFSVYAGDVATVSDLSQASPLECTVPPGRPPVPGEHISVADTLPDPPLGEARYYLAAVSYHGQRRAGRQSLTGVLQGRNAAALSGCP